MAFYRCGSSAGGVTPKAIEMLQDDSVDTVQIVNNYSSRTTFNNNKTIAAFGSTTYNQVDTQSTYTNSTSSGNAYDAFAYVKKVKTSGKFNILITNNTFGTMRGYDANLNLTFEIIQQAMAVQSTPNLLDVLSLNANTKYIVVTFTNETTNRDARNHSIMLYERPTA